MSIIRHEDGSAVLGRLSMSLRSVNLWTACVRL